MSWQVTGAVSVTVRRDGQQVSTDAAGVRTFTVADKHPITWAVAASNRAGATSEEVTVRPVTFGSAASFITSGMEAAGGLWVGQLVLAFLPGLVIILVAVVKGSITPAPFIAAGILAPVLAFLFAALFNFTAGYWLAASLTILLVLAVVTWVQLEKGIAPRVKPFHRPSSQTPALALVKPAAQGRPAATRGDCHRLGDSFYHYPPLKITAFQASERRDCRPGADLGRFWPHEADCAEPRPMVIGL